MSDWRKQLHIMYSTLEEAEVLHNALISIDKKIINEDDIEKIVKYGYLKLCELTQAVYINFHVGDSIISYKDSYKTKEYTDCALDSYTIQIDINEEDWETYIDKVTVFNIKKDSKNSKDDDPLNINKEIYRQSIETISRQLNIAINNDISKSINILYKQIIEQFSHYGDVNRIFDLICKKIINIFPSFSDIGEFDTKLLNIQISLFENETTEDLRIVGSDNEKNIGGVLKPKESICGAIFRYLNRVELPYGYKKAKYKNIRYVYFMGNPNKTEFYQKVTIQASQSELSVPLFTSKGRAIGVINLESLKKNMFKDTHAKTLIYNSIGIAELVDNIWRLSSGRKHIVHGFFSNIERYIAHVLREYRHSLGHPLQTLSKATFDIQENCNNSEDVISLLDKVHDGIDRNKNILTDALMGIVDRGSSINLYDKIKIAKSFIQADLDQEKIEFILKKDPNVNEVVLDNLFPQYLYSLFHNSISSIIQKKMRLAKTTVKDYSPYIKIIVSSPNAYNISFKKNNSAYKAKRNSQKCRITICDNGDGIEEKKLKTLGRYQVSHQNRSGTGLYSFKQYLLIHNGRIIDFRSKLHESFCIDFVIDME